MTNLLSPSRNLDESKNAVIRNNEAGDIPAVILVDDQGGVGGGAVRQIAKDLTSAIATAEQFGNFANIATGDFVTRKIFSNGQTVTALSSSPLTDDSISSIVFQGEGKQPCALELEASISQRVRHDFAIMALYADSPDGPDTPPADIAISRIYQSSADNGAAYNTTAGTIVTVLLASAIPQGVFLTDWINIFGLIDNRLNYPNAAIKYISADRKTVTFGFSDEVVLPSIAVDIVSPPNAFVRFYNNMSGAQDGAAFRFTGNSATSAALVSLFGGGDIQISGTPLGDHRVTISSTNPIYNLGVDGQSEIKATSRYRIEGRPRDLTFYDTSADAANAYTHRAVRTGVKPNSESLLKPRFRMVSPKSMTKPVAEIVSITKSGGNNTCTVVTRKPHGLITNNYVTVKNVRDQTNFANSATPAQVTVINANTFTVPWGNTTAISSYGGSIILVNGGVDQQGLNTAVVQQASYDSATDRLTLSGLASWATGVGVLNIGDYMELYGILDSAGVPIGYNLSSVPDGVNGAWEVAYVSGTTLILTGINNIAGVRVSPQPVGNITATNCGGCVIHRTTLRSHDFIFENWNETLVGVRGQGTTRQDLAVPVRLLADDTSATAKAQQGVAARAASVSGNPVLTGMRGSSAQPTAVANGQVVDPMSTLIGAGVYKPYAIPELDWNSSLALTNTTAAAIQAAAGAGLKRHITAGQFINTGGSAVDLIILDGATERWRLALPVNVPVAFEFPTEIVTTANTALNANLSAAGTVRANFQGYTAP